MTKKHLIVEMSYAVISLINRIISWCSESNLHHFITKCNKGKTLKQLNDLQPSRLWRLQEIRLNRFSLSQLQTTNKLVQALSFPLTNSLFNKQQMQQRKDSKKQPKALQPPCLQGYKRQDFSKSLPHLQTAVTLGLFQPK